jgi:hypothetical protein
MASSSAMGMLALEVLPYFSMLRMKRSRGTSTRAATCARMRRFAWCATTQSMSFGVRPVSSRTAFVAPVRFFTATLKISWPAM